MAFNLSELRYILSTIDDLLSMSGYQYSVNISNGYDEDDDTVAFIKLIFPLKNGTSEIMMYDSMGFIAYIDNNGEILENIEFNDRSIAAINSSFKKAIRQIIAFDLQNNNKEIKSVNNLIDRASFGLAEVD
jgi:hypothetical protein